MRKTHVILLLALLALVVAGCGGGDENVPDGAVAVVDGEEITKSEFDALMTRAKSSYTQNKREWPKVGTPEYKTLQNQAVAYLVQQEKYRQKAEDLDVEVTDKEVDERMQQVITQYFSGKREDFEKNLKEQGLNEEQVRAEIENQVVSEKIYEKVTEGVKVTDAEIQKYYASHKSDYKVAESRDVRLERP